MPGGAPDPAKNDDIWRSVCTKELVTWLSPLRKLHPDEPGGSGEGLSESGCSYRLPVPGEAVTVSGMRRRPELNGVRGEIVNGAPDEFGRVTVQIYDGATGAAGGTRKMKIQPFRLVPSGSAPSLGPASTAAFRDFPDDRSSVRSASRPGSMLSGAGGRALGSAISSSARGALAGGRRTATPAPSGMGQARTPSALSRAC